MLGNSKRGIRLNLLAGICVLALCAAASAAKAQESAKDTASSDQRQEASAVTDARANAQPPAIAVSERQGSEPQAAEPHAEQTTPLHPVDVKPAPNSGVNSIPRPYYIEFRARAAYNYGHAFVVHGRVGEAPTKKSVVGLHPIGESPASWLIGHVVPVPSETGWSDGDVGYNDRYITAKYRIFLTEAEYRVVLAKLREMQASSPIWSAELYNCVAFVGDIATFLGMQHPFHWVMPKEYIEGIKYMAGGRQQLPSSWLERVNPRLAAQQAAQFAHARQAASQAEQAQESSKEPPKEQAQERAKEQPARPQTASAPRSSGNARRHASAVSPTAPVPSSYAGVR